jgi:hypothetical protein
VPANLPAIGPDGLDGQRHPFVRVTDIQVKPPAFDQEVARDAGVLARKKSLPNGSRGSSGD